MSQTTFNHVFVNAAYGKLQDSRILFKKNGELEKVLPQAKSAFGKRKVQPTGDTLAVLQEEENRRIEVQKAVVEAWDQTGEIPVELEQQLLEIS